MTPPRTLSREQLKTLTAEQVAHVPLQFVDLHNEGVRTLSSVWGGDPSQLAMEQFRPDLAEENAQRLGGVEHFVDCILALGRGQVPDGRGHYAREDGAALAAAAHPELW